MHKRRLASIGERGRWRAVKMAGRVKKEETDGMAGRGGSRGKRKGRVGERTDSIMIG